MITSLKYELIDRESERGEWLSRAVPYGGHMLKFDMLPPLYELQPDYLVVSDNIKSGLETLIDVLEQGKTAYFHLMLKDADIALKGLDRTVLSELSRKIKGFGELGKRIVYLPAHAEMLYIFDDESEKLLLTHIFDHGELEQQVRENALYQIAHRKLSKYLKREYMIWKPTELNGPLISVVWSKRVITPKEIISKIAPSKDNAILTRCLKGCAQPFKRKVTNNV